RARIWCTRLEKHRSDTALIGELYAGDHWTVVLSLPAVARAAGFEPQLWVISAGYGLVSERARLHSYSATFGRAYLDSVATCGGAEAQATNQAWWSHLTNWRGPEQAPRSLEMLVRQDPRAGLLVMGSADYIRAVEDDLLAAAKRLDDPARLVVISGQE